MGNKIKWLGYVSLFLLAGFAFSCADGTPAVTEQLTEATLDGDAQAAGDDPAAGVAAADMQPDQPEADTVFVYVCGAVCNPGVYELDNGARIIDAIQAAGGMDQAAAVSYVNQAERIADGQQIYIPTEAEVAAGQSDVMPGQSGNAAADSSGLININTATREELMQLSGIGETKAGNIITWREQHGGFEKIEDITKVDGIGDGTFLKLKDFICVS